MDEIFEIDGDWWLPEKPDNRISGKLNFSPIDGIVLNLFGTFESNGLDSFFTRSEYYNYPLILGESKLGKLITLYNNFEIWSNINESGGNTLKLKAHFLFINVHFRSIDEIRFKSYFVRYSNLDVWVNAKVFSSDYEQLGKGIFNLKYERPSSVKMEFDDLELAFEIRGPNITGNISEVNISQKAWVGLNSLTEKPLDEYMKIMWHLGNFLSLAMNYPTYPLEVEGKISTPFRIRQPSTSVDIYYEFPRWPGNIKTLYSLDMLFTLPDIKDDMEMYITNWIQVADLFRPIYALYFSFFTVSSMYLESKFLNLVQAIEAYHSRKFGGKYQPDEVYESGLYKVFQSVIPSDLDSDFKQSLVMGKLKYANEYSLRKRIKELVGKILSKYPLNFLEGNFITKTTNTRNYLTHYDPELMGKAAEGENLLHLVQKLQIIMIILFLEEIGLTENKIINFLLRNSTYRDFFITEG